RDLVGIEAVERSTERLALLEHREPRQPGLVHLQHQPLEQRVLVAHRKAVLGVGVGAVPGIARREVAVRAHSAPMSAISTPSIAASRSSSGAPNSALGVPAAHQTTSNLVSERSASVRIGRSWPSGGTPPIA